MGEETTWFDFLPGTHNLREALAHALGRETPDEGFSKSVFYQWQMFSDSSFTTLGYSNKAYQRITEIRDSVAGVFQNRYDTWACSVNIRLCN